MGIGRWVGQRVPGPVIGVRIPHPQSQISFNYFNQTTTLSWFGLCLKSLVAFYVTPLKYRAQANLFSDYETESTKCIVSSSVFVSGNVNNDVIAEEVFDGISVIGK